MACALALHLRTRDNGPSLVLRLVTRAATALGAKAMREGSLEPLAVEIEGTAAEFVAAVAAAGEIAFVAPAAAPEVAVGRRQQPEETAEVTRSVVEAEERS